MKYKTDLIDPWEMSVKPLEGTYEGKFLMKFPSKSFLAIRFQKAE